MTGKRVSESILEIMPKYYEEGANKNTRNRVLLLGAPGSGKSTLAKEIIEKFNLQHISTGVILRKEIKDGTEIGKIAAEYINKGKLVPCEIVGEIVDKQLGVIDASKGFMLDGFPRTIKQAKILDDILSKRKLSIDGVINLVVDDAEVIKRITGRRVCNDCGETYNLNTAPPKNEDCDKCGGELVIRNDDKEEAVKNRLEEFHKSNQPILDFYKEKGILKNFNAETIEGTYNEVALYMNGGKDKEFGNNSDKILVQKILDSLQQIHDLYIDKSNKNSELQEQKEIISSSLMAVSKEIYNSIPKDSLSFKKSNISGEDLNWNLVKKIEKVNRYADAINGITQKMLLNLQEPKKQIQEVVEKLDRIVMMHQEGKFTSGKELMEDINILKDMANKKQQDILVDERICKYDLEQSRNLSISKYVSNFIKPSYLSAKRRGIYLPARFKSYMDVKNDYNSYIIHGSPERNVYDFEKNIKESIVGRKSLQNNEKFKFILDAKKLYQKGSNLLNKLEIHNTMNFMIWDKASFIKNSLEKETMSKFCLPARTKGIEEEYSEMIEELGKIIKGLEKGEKKVDILCDKVININKNIDKTVKNIMRQRFVNKKTKNVDEIKMVI